MAEIAAKRKFDEIETDEYEKDGKGQEVEEEDQEEKSNGGTLQMADDEVQVIDDILFLSHFTIKFVQESKKHFYFQIEALGIDPPIRLYKSTLETLKNALHRCINACEEAQKTMTLMSKDAEIFESVIDTSKDGEFQTRLTASIYCKKIGIYLRTFVKSDETGEWLHSKRAVRFSTSRREFMAFNDFVNTRFKIQQAEKRNKKKKID